MREGISFLSRFAVLQVVIYCAGTKSCPESFSRFQNVASAWVWCTMYQFCKQLNWRIELRNDLFIMENVFMFENLFLFYQLEMNSSII